MPQQSDIWAIEELLWTGATDAFRRRMADGCLMAFPGVGCLQGEEILESLKDVPRWQSVQMEGRRALETDGLIVLCYHAHAVREGDAPHDAMCTSTWLRREGGWQLIQHQQGPMEARRDDD